MSGDLAQQPFDLVLSEAEISTRQANATPTFFHSLLAIAGGQLGCTLIAALAELCFARLLGPGPRGLASLCLMSVAFGALIGSLGSEATVVVWISRFRGRHSIWIPAVMFWVTLGCMLAALTWIWVYWKWNPAFLKGVTSQLALLILAAIPCSVLFSMAMALFVGEERFRLRAAVALFNRISSLIAFFVAFLFLGRRAETVVLANITGLVVGVCIAIVFLRHFLQGAWKLQDIRDNLFPTLLFGIRGQAGNLASFFSYRLDVFVVNYFLDAPQVGLYALGVLVSEALWQLPGIVSVALFPRTARTVGAGANNFTSMVLRQVFLITTVVALVVALLSPIAIPLLFGARYAPSIPVIWWILPGTIALSLGKVIAADLTGRSLNKHLPISAFIGFAITILLDLFLIPRMGIQGAALASSVAYLLAAGYLFMVIRQELKTSWKTLIVPTRAEWLAYKRVWVAFRDRFPPA